MSLTSYSLTYIRPSNENQSKYLLPLHWANNKLAVLLETYRSDKIKKDYSTSSCKLEYDVWFVLAKEQPDYDTNGF